MYRRGGGEGTQQGRRCKRDHRGAEREREAEALYWLSVSKCVRALRRWSTEHWQEALHGFRGNVLIARKSHCTSYHGVFCVCIAVLQV